MGTGQPPILAFDESSCKNAILNRRLLETDVSHLLWKWKKCHFSEAGLQKALAKGEN